VVRKGIKSAYAHLKKQSFVSGALTLAGASIVCRLLGVGLRIPLANIVGNYGMGLYQMVFPLYALLLIVSSAGVPIAISKMVARSVSGQAGERGDTQTTSLHRSAKQAEDQRGVHVCQSRTSSHASPPQILINAIVLLGTIGLVISALFFGLSHLIASLQGNTQIGPVYMAIAPAVFLVCIIGAFRGYFQGLGNMIPTGTSQIVEQIVKVGTGLALAILLLPHGVAWAVFGAILAVTISELIALVVLILIYLIHRKRLVNACRGGNLPPEKQTPSIKPALSIRLMWNILKKSFPITLLASVFPLLLVFDSMVVINMLRSGGASETVATQLYGISSGTVHTLINMPAVLGVAIGMAVIPMVARLLAQKNIDEAQQKFALALKLIFVFGLFFALFYIVFGREMIILLYERAFNGNADHLHIASILLKIEAGMILLMGASQVFTSLLQGASKSYQPLLALAIGGVAKIAFQLVFIRTPMGIFAVSIGNVLMFAIAFSINLFFVWRFFKKQGIPREKRSINWRMVGKLAILATVYVGLLAALVFLLPRGKYWILLGGAVATLTYATLVWLLGIFKKPNALPNNPQKSQPTSAS